MNHGQLPRQYHAISTERPALISPWDQAHPLVSAPYQSDSHSRTGLRISRNTCTCSKRALCVTYAGPLTFISSAPRCDACVRLANLARWMTVMSPGENAGATERGGSGGEDTLAGLERSASYMKAVTPGGTRSRRDDMDVSDGGVAMCNFRRATSSPLLEARKERRLLDALKNQQLWLVRWMLSRDETNSGMAPNNVPASGTRPRSSSVEVDPCPPPASSYYEERDSDGRTPLHFAARWGVSQHLSHLKDSVGGRDATSFFFPRWAPCPYRPLFSCINTEHGGDPGAGGQEV